MGHVHSVFIDLYSRVPSFPSPAESQAPLIGMLVACLSTPPISMPKNRSPKTELWNEKTTGILGCSGAYIYGEG